ncbi:MAG: orotate phosphoribosyltransferase [Rhodospirillales bacterium]|nr:orotate phosphoribosyltransferase [Rhodospirillales bacterium]
MVKNPGIAERTPEQKAAGQAAAKYLIDIKAVNFRPDEPYKLTAGWASPVYVDCRKVIAFLEERRAIIQSGVDMLNRDISEEPDLVAGGETAGIPYAAWISEALSKPMLYVRKKPKGFGRNAQIEGDMPEGSHVLLVEDLATDGGSKINFINALRDSGATVSDVFVVFFYGAFPGAADTMAAADVTLHYLCDWWDVIAAAEAGRYFTPNDIAGVRAFLADPAGWSKCHGGK